MNPRILIADDHEIVRAGIRTLISRARPDWQICGEASCGDEAVEMVTKLHPDLIVLDLSMPGMSGFQACSKIVKLGLYTRVLIFTMQESSTLAAAVINCGAHGFVSKSQSARDLIVAIETLLGGGGFFGSPSGPRSRTGPSSGTFLTFQPGMRHQPTALHRAWP